MVNLHKRSKKFGLAKLVLIIITLFVLKVVSILYLCFTFILSDELAMMMEGRSKGKMKKRKHDIGEDDMGHAEESPKKKKKK